MRKNFLFLGSTAFALLLLGAGCNKMPTDTEEQAQNTAPTNDTQEQKSGGFNLSVEQPTELAKNKEVYVKFFNVPEDFKKNADGYRIVMGRDANPTKENATYWYQLGKNHEEKILTNMPSGIRHFRVCVMEKEQCTAYSNDAEINFQ